MELTYVGVKYIKIELDDETIEFRSVLLRRAPGNIFYDYVQELDLAALDER